MSIFQWFKEDVLLPNVNGPFLNVTVRTPGTDGGNYTCTVSNVAGTESATSSLYVLPVIISQPINVSTVIGSTVRFSCEADGFPMPTYQWEKARQDGSFIKVPGAINQTLTLQSVSFEDNGRYRCITTITYPIGSLSDASSYSTSTAATLTSKPQFYSLCNLTITRSVISKLWCFVTTLYDFLR